MSADEPEFITPPNALKGKVSVGGPGGIDMKALERAESVIAGLQDNYLEWVQDDLTALQAAYEKALSDPQGRKHHLVEIFRISHDIKGQGGSFGYDLITIMGNQLCRFLESLEDKEIRDSHLDVVKVHIDSMRLVIGKRMEGEGGKVGDQILAGLEAVIKKVKN